MLNKLSLFALPNVPEVLPGDDVGALMCEWLAASEITLQPHDIIVIAQKIISKAEDRYVYFRDVVPSKRAEQVALEVDKGARLVELILSESDEISRMRKGVLVVRHRLGFVSANAGIDRSNVPQDCERERVLLLPVDPDKSAEKILHALQKTYNLPLGVIITDSHGRPHRKGTTGIAIGVAGIPAVLDKRGSADRYGYILQHTDIGIADEISAAASLLMGQAGESQPIIILRGLELPQTDGKASDIYRPKEKDLYR